MHIYMTMDVSSYTCVPIHMQTHVQTHTLLMYLDSGKGHITL